MASGPGSSCSTVLSGVCSGSRGDERHIESCPASYGNGVDYLQLGRDIYALDLRTKRNAGLQRRLQDHRQRAVGGGGTVADGVGVSRRLCGRVLALRRENGKLLEQSAEKPDLRELALAGGRLFVPSRGAGALYDLHEQRQLNLWPSRTGGPCIGARGRDGRVYFRIIHGHALLRLRRGPDAVSGRGYRGRADIRIPRP